MENKQQTQFTPAPWKVCLETTPGQFGTDYVIRNKHNHHIAIVSLSTDAPLIAAAPELLEALEALADEADSDNRDEAVLTALVENARAAIAKAKGVA